MKKYIPTFGLSLFFAISAIAQTAPPGDSARSSPERIGIYDSRAVAVAYAGSAFQEEKMNDLRNQLRKAKEAGNTREVSRLEADGKGWQAQLHRQGFGTAPVDDILAHISSDLPGIQQSAGVSVLVSKWNQPELDRHPKAERIDVTLQLVDAFHPNEKQRNRALEVQKKSPVKVKE
jgi:hypothetical protein